MYINHCFIKTHMFLFILFTTTVILDIVLSDMTVLIHTLSYGFVCYEIICPGIATIHFVFKPICLPIYHHLVCKFQYCIYVCFLILPEIFAMLTLLLF